MALLQSTTKSIRSIGDLQKPSIEIGVDDTPYNRHYFKIENEPIRKKFYKSKVIPPDAPETFMNMTYGISRVRDGISFNPFFFQLKIL